jgi:hypothetical protein
VDIAVSLLAMVESPWDSPEVKANTASSIIGKRNFVVMLKGKTFLLLKCNC